jgi:hypothetical protein
LGLFFELGKIFFEEKFPVNSGGTMLGYEVSMLLGTVSFVLGKVVLRIVFV